MKITDSVALGDTRVNDAGYLEANARTARVGVQQYLGSEVGKPELGIVNVYRDEREVFSKRSLDTFSKIPVTNDHPAEPVTADNWRQLAVGTTGDEVLRDGEYLKIGLKITDAAAVKAVRDGKRELSVGYTTDLIWEDGIAPDGTPYQARQTAIAANHIAIVARGRAGSQARIGDSASDKWGAAPISTTDKETVDMTDALRTVVVDGLSVQTTDQGAQAIAKLQKDLESSAAKLTAADAAHTAALAAKDEEIGTLKAENQQLKDGQLKPEDLDRMVADRASLIETVKTIDSKIEIKGSDADLRRAAVKAKLGDEMVKDASDAEISGMFKAIAKDVKTADPFRQVAKDGLHQSTGDAQTQAHDAWNKSVADLNSWRKEA